MVYDKRLLDYINTALWSSIDHNEEPMDTNYSIGDFDPDTLKQLKIELFDFIDKYYSLVDSNDRNTGLDHFVHNFWLTRNGHGTGFWSGGYVNGEELAKTSEKYSEINLYLGDDKKIYKG